MRSGNRARGWSGKKGIRLQQQRRRKTAKARRGGAPSDALTEARAAKARKRRLHHERSKANNRTHRG